MTVLRFNLHVDGQFDACVLAQAADVLKEELSKQPEIGESLVQPLGVGRSGAGLVCAIALAITLITDGAKGIEAILKVIERLRKLRSTSNETAKVFSRVKARDLLVDVDGVLVPLPELTEAHLKAIREQN